MSEWRFIVLAATVLATPLAAAEPRLEKLWQTEATLKVPESVLYDAARKVLYVSNIDGTQPWENDGVGSIGRLDLDGNIIEVDWVDGLNGPKGMALAGDRLYVTDNDAVVTIDIEKGAIIDRLPVPDAGNINDISLGEDGVLYVTDSKKGLVHELADGEFTTLVDGLTALNGVLYSDGELFFVADGGLHLVGDDGAYTTLASGIEGRVDGVERIDADSWLVSCWKGPVFHVTRDGEVTLLDDESGTIVAADMGYDPVNRIAFFPGFWENTVAAYRLVID
ncbi:SMP-30/gluconolactonase/LRE family protein [Marinihelvus fidelis]|uniref:SMP-30/gluconolactonase/LRE family protein n=1 Tax=Marinihelvus fidelis TaxID=2613842 RepID=A0A5N0TCK0_9GAMM|nr:SMP-30/gluconolactonase/LRE family protein [Marinihelvus fidelis]KAA9131576.1 SMP-30/gluconolactonase/LRE family protein [Marinihelvus fidelis]